MHPSRRASQPRGLATLAVLGVTWLGYGAAQAAEPVWSAPADCPDAATVAHKVDLLLRGHEYSPAQLARFEGRVSRARADRWVLRLSLAESGTENERVLVASRCADLADAAALAIALAIQPELRRDAPALPTDSAAHQAANASVEPGNTEGSVAPASSPTKTSDRSTSKKTRSGTLAARASSPEPAPPASPAQKEPGMPPTASDPTPPAWSVLAADANPVAPIDDSPRGAMLGAVTLESGSLPTTAMGYTLGTAVWWRRLRFELSGGISPRATSERDAKGNYASLSLYRGELGACVSPLSSWLNLFGCAQIGAGAIFARGHGVSDPRATTSPWFAPGAALLALGRLSQRLSLTAKLALEVPLTHDRFEVDREPAHETDAVVLRGALGLEYRFRWPGMTKADTSAIGDTAGTGNLGNGS